VGKELESREIEARCASGNVGLNCEVPTVRCGMTTHAQDSLPKDPSILRSIVKDANQNLGIYASVISPGAVSLGDRVEFT
jgi:uncharacterized protein